MDLEKLLQVAQKYNLEELFSVPSWREIIKNDVDFGADLTLLHDLEQVYLLFKSYKEKMGETVEDNDISIKTDVDTSLKMIFNPNGEYKKTEVKNEKKEEI